MNKLLIVPINNFLVTFEDGKLQRRFCSVESINILQELSHYSSSWDVIAIDHCPFSLESFYQLCITEDELGTTLTTLLNAVSLVILIFPEGKILKIQKKIFLDYSEEMIIEEIPEGFPLESDQKCEQLDYILAQTWFEYCYSDFSRNYYNPVAQYHKYLVVIGNRECYKLLAKNFGSVYVPSDIFSQYSDTSIPLTQLPPISKDVNNFLVLKELPFVF
ncbi:hypothetical protein [Crocosphaera sp. XPORK-15E]|uniref:hypothetical protein n=1 Tax=Crocosphaera sp. XPORK-15E TaxID=3110247 RepID=UPI002B206292|nr:hypothetical protein [Crocosphaera sp. XPORK-15E]MEA5536612.1 hypothetical protein [Crocosphaera sp. XPORK-15E]